MNKDIYYRFVFYLNEKIYNRQHKIFVCFVFINMKNISVFLNYCLLKYHIKKMFNELL